MEYDDKLSVAMITFINCVRQYDSDKGNFITYVQVSIKNRIIDEIRKEQRYPKNFVSIESEEDVISSAEYRVSLSSYNNELESKPMKII